MRILDKRDALGFLLIRYFFVPLRIVHKEKLRFFRMWREGRTCSAESGVGDGQGLSGDSMAARVASLSQNAGGMTRDL